MSISGALSNAYSGLSAMSRSVETVSNNVSNALTEGYSQQSVEYSAAVLVARGSGVRVEGILRSENPAATYARRQTESELRGISVESSVIKRLAHSLGEPGSPTALASRYLAFESSIANAINAPDSAALLQDILVSAKHLTGAFNQISSEANRVRLEADAAIAKNVELVNSSLLQIEDLNYEIRSLSLSGRASASLEDQRQGLIDQVNSAISVRISKSDDGDISLFTRDGGILLNGSARLLEFQKTSIIAPEMTLATGTLSGVSVKGQPIKIGAGSLSAHFAVRDQIAPQFQTQLDALSTDLISRFQNWAADPTTPTNSAGLFTDAGSIISGTINAGLSARISVNALVDPKSGGEVWRLRDGLGATTQGNVGETAQLLRMADTLSAVTMAVPELNLASASTAVGFTEELTSAWALRANRVEVEVANKSAVFSVFRSEEMNSTGVDSDKEMQTLLVIEQAYAANARVISVIDKLIKKLMEI